MLTFVVEHIPPHMLQVQNINAKLGDVPPTPEVPVDVPKLIDPTK